MLSILFHVIDHRTTNAPHFFSISIPFVLVVVAAVVADDRSDREDT
jgi:hypothetical protein